MTAKGSVSDKNRREEAVLTGTIPLWAYTHKTLKVMSVPETLEYISLIVEIGV